MCSRSGAGMSTYRTGAEVMNEWQKLFTVHRVVEVKNEKRIEPPPLLAALGNAMRGYLWSFELGCWNPVPNLMTAQEFFTPGHVFAIPVDSGIPLAKVIHEYKVTSERG